MMAFFLCCSIFAVIGATLYCPPTGPMACKRIHGYTPSPSSSPSPLLSSIGLASTTATSSSSSSPFSPELSYKCRVKDLLHHRAPSSSPRDTRVKLTFSQKLKVYQAVASDSFDQVRAVLDDILLDVEDGAKLNLDFTVNDFLPARSPLQRAACLGRPDIIKLLIDAGANPNYTESTDGCTALHLALQYHQQDKSMIKYLIEAGADLIAQNEAGQTCFMFACRTCELEVIMMIISNSPDVQNMVSMQDENGFNAVHFLAENNWIDHEEVLSVLCRQPFDRSVLSVGSPKYMNANNPVGNGFDEPSHLPLASPLERAILLGRGILAVALLKHGAIPYSRAANFRTGTSLTNSSPEALARYNFLCACTKLYEQCREEIITLGMHVYNPRLADRHGALKDVFPLILPYMWYINRLPALIAEHFTTTQ